MSVIYTARFVKNEIRDRLADAGIAEAEHESSLILEWICGIDRMNYLMNPDAPVSEDRYKDLQNVLGHRERREPLQYLMKSADFMGYSFYVDERTLIPRQDTECLVELAAERIGKEDSPEVLDLCCGSGCIGISIGKICPKAQITLADFSADALEVAGINAERLNQKAVRIHSNLLDDVPGRYDYILSNPPYIPTKVVEELMPEVKDYEPRMALDGSDDGLMFYRKIIDSAPDHLKTGGQLIFEIGYDQGEALETLLTEAGFSQVEVHKDLAGLDRVVCGIL